MLSKTSAYVKSYDGENKLMYFFIEGNELLEKYITAFGITLVIVLRKNLIANPCTIKNF